MITFSIWFTDLNSELILNSKIAPILSVVGSLVLLWSVGRFFYKASKKDNVSKSKAIWFQNKNRYQDSIDFNKLGNS